MLVTGEQRSASIGDGRQGNKLLRNLLFVSRGLLWLLLCSMHYL